MLKSKNFFVCLLVALALLTTMANATVSRLEGLGGSGDPYWWGLPGNIFVLHDAATPGIWPQLIQQYPNLAGGEFGYDMDTWDLQKVYVNYSWSEKKAALQFALDKPYSDRYTMMPQVYDLRFYPTPTSTNAIPGRLNATFGCKLGDDMLIGGNLSYFGHSYEDETYDLSGSIIGVKVGLSGIGDHQWDAVVGVELPSFKNDSSGTSLTENNGSMGVHFAGRYWWDYSEKTALIPNVRFNMYKDAAKTSVTGVGDFEDNITNTQIAIGAGHNWWPVENALVLSDIGIVFNTSKEEYVAPGASSDETWKANVLPYWRIGFETSIFSWLDGRLGAERAWLGLDYKDTGQTPTFNPKSSTSVTSTFLGATAHWNRMIFDLVVHPNFIGNGPNFISGANSGQMFTRVSLKYDFNH